MARVRLILKNPNLNIGTVRQCLRGVLAEISPDFDEHNLLLEKALRVGGPAHAGLSPEQVAARANAARVEAQGWSQKLEERLDEIVTAWQSAVELRDMARAAGVPNEQLEPHLAKVRASLERSGRGELRAVYRRMWPLGRANAGNLGVASADERAALTRLYREKQQFFSNMLDDIDTKTFRMPISQRVPLYALSSMEAFWMGYLMADLSPDRYVRWRLRGNKETCEDCLKLATGGRWSNGVYRARELAVRGLAPRCGKLRCFCRCGCELEEATRPDGPETGVPLERMELVGPGKGKHVEGQGGETPTSFTGNGRTGRERHVRGHKRNSWNWKGRK